LTTRIVGESTIRNPRHKLEKRLRPSSTLGEEQPEEAQDEVTKLNPERERFSVPHARDPRILKDMKLENEDIFEIIRKPPEVSAVQIFEKPEFWDLAIGLTHAVTTQGIATIQLGGYSHYHPILLEGRRKRKGKNLGRRNRNSTTNSH